MKKIALAFLFLIFTVRSSTAAEILVSAASDLAGAFREIGAMYEKESGDKVERRRLTCLLPRTGVI